MTRSELSTQTRLRPSRATLLAVLATLMVLSVVSMPSASATPVREDSDVRSAWNSCTGPFGMPNFLTPGEEMTVVVEQEGARIIVTAYAANNYGTGGVGAGPVSLDIYGPCVANIHGRYKLLLDVWGAHGDSGGKCLAGYGGEVVSSGAVVVVEDIGVECRKWGIDPSRFQVVAHVGILEPYGWREELVTAKVMYL